jgi:hypothetical protein
MNPEATGKRWFYVRDGRRHGPVEVGDIVGHILAGDLPEDALVWHTGLPEWVAARDVEAIRLELPPPVPVPPAPEPVLRDDAEDEDEEYEEEDEDHDDEENGEDEAPLAAVEGAASGAPPGSDPSAKEPPAIPAAGPGSRKRRRKRKRRAHTSKRRPAWLWPLVVILVGLMIGLWWLLIRMNEVPPGRIIQTGRIDGGARLPARARPGAQGQVQGDVLAGALDHHLDVVARLVLAESVGVVVDVADLLRPEADQHVPAL